MNADHFCHDAEERAVAADRVLAESMRLPPSEGFIRLKFSQARERGRWPIPMLDIDIFGGKL